MHFAVVFCMYDKRTSVVLNKIVSYCEIKEKIGSEDYFVEPLIDTTCEVFNIQENKDVKYLPKRIGEVLPNLMEIKVVRCGLMIIRDFYFENMLKLEFLILDENKIVTIERNAFKGLFRVVFLWLRGNLIQTLDKNLFSSMTRLEKIFLHSNKIKFLNPSTFDIPGSTLQIVNLADNICIHQIYDSFAILNEFELDIKVQCSPNATELSSQGKLNKM